MSVKSKLFGNTKDQKLMDLFLELTAKVKSSSSYLHQLMTQYNDETILQTCCFNIQTIESDGDMLVKQIIELLGEISITSWINHETALRLLHMLDEILDNCQCIVRLTDNYRLTKISTEMLLLAGVIDTGAKEIEALMNLFCRPNYHKHQTKIIAHIKKVRELEQQGDILKSKGLHALLHFENPDQPLTRRELAEFRSSEKMLEVLEMITDDIHHLSTTVHQSISE